MDEPISDRCFTDMPLLGIRNIEMPVGFMAVLKGDEIVLELKNVVF
jgi:hypothetical protein